MYVFAPEQLDVIDGLRAALSIGLLLAGAICLDYPDLSFGAVAAFWTCLVDPFGNTRRRVNVMVKFALLGATVLVLSSFGASFGPVVATVTLSTLVALCCLGRTYAAAFGPGPTQGSFLAAIAVVIGVSIPRPLESALALGACFLIGATLAVVISTLVMPNRANGTARLMQVTIYGRLRTMLVDLIALDQLTEQSSAGWEHYETSVRRAVRVSIERGRQIIAQRLMGSQTHGKVVDLASRIFATLIALGNHRRDNGNFADDDLALLRELDALLLKVIECLDAGKSPTLDIENGALALGARADLSQDKVVGRCIGMSARTLVQLMDTKIDQHQDGKSADDSFSLLKKPVRPPKAVWQHSVRASVAVTACQIAGGWGGVGLAYWGAIAALIVLQPVFGNTVARVLERAVGTVVGGILAALMLMSDPGKIAISAMIVPLAVIVISLRTVNYALFAGFLTPMFMLLTDLIKPTDGLILLRLINESLGALFAVVASMLIFPTNHRAATLGAIREAVCSNLKYAATVLRLTRDTEPELIALAQANAGIASSRAEVAAAGEGVWSHTFDRDTLDETLVAIRNVCGATAVWEILNDERTDANKLEAMSFDALSTSLQEQLETQEIREPPANAPKTDSILDHAASELLLAVQSLISRSASNGLQDSVRSRVSAFLRRLTRFH